MINPPPLLHRRFYRRLTPVARTGLLLLGVLAGLAVAWVLGRGLGAGGALQVLFPDGREQPVAAGAGFEIEFSRQVDPVEFHDHIQVDPPIDGEWELKGASATFRPSTPLPYGARLAVLLRDGLSGLDGTRLRTAVTAEFRVREPLVAYLRGAGLSLVAESRAGDLQALLASPEEVVDFAVSPDGEKIAYSAISGSGGQDLWLLDRETLQAELLLACDGQVCSELDWAPDGERLVFTRRDPGQDPNLSKPRIWTVSVADRVAAPLYRDEQVLGRDPIWSPDGLALAFYDPGATVVRLLDLDTVREQIIPGGSGGTGAWSPDSQSFVLVRQQFGEESVSADLVLVDTETRQARLLTDRVAGWRDISQPRWSPDGEWIAFAGQSASTGRAKGLFLIRPDGTGLREVASQPGINHGAYSWDPLGTMLLYQQFDLHDPLAVPIVALWERDSGEVREIASEAYAPAWLP